MQLLILSDIHGNLSALDAVLADAFLRFNPSSIALLGDNIDYGMRSNEVIERLSTLKINLICSLWGNHEQAILYNDYSRFSSKRGADCARYTASQLNAKSQSWLLNQPGKTGFMTFLFCENHFFAVHGSSADYFWESIFPGDLDYSAYEAYDVVLSGHSHLPHVFSVFHPCDNKRTRNRKRTIFINPGSVGQPRDCDSRAHYAIWDSNYGVSLCVCDYDIAFEQSLYVEEVDSFYRSRLAFGI